MIDSLSILVGRGFLADYRYLVQDLRFVSRQTIPYKLFDEGDWKYDQEKYLKELEALLEGTREDWESRLLGDQEHPAHSKWSASREESVL